MSKSSPRRAFLRPRDTWQTDSATLPCRLLLWFTATLVAAHVGISRAETHQSLEQIRAAVLQFVQSDEQAGRVVPEIRGLDRRLRLAPCKAPLSVFWPPGVRRVGNTTVGVRCEGEHHWKIYVPMRIASYKRVVVAAHQVASGETLAVGDLVLEERDVASLTRGYVTDLSRMVGHRTKRRLRAGDALVPSMVVAPAMVKRGEKVTVLAQTGSIEVRMAGTALADGGAGNTVKVRSLSSNRVIEGEVIAKGLVRVRM